MALKDYTEGLLAEVKLRGAEAILGEEVFTTLKWLTRQTHLQTNHARMLVGEEEGAFLNLFVKKYIGCNKNSSEPGELKILEIGTFTGYSLICLASAIAGFSHEPLRYTVEAFEINEEPEELIYEALQRSNIEKFTTVTFGDAKSILAAMPLKEEYDIIFIDANKREYPLYLSLTLPLLKRGGYILADNVLWYGNLEKGKSDPQTQGIMLFNSAVEALTACGSIESYLLALRDGVYVLRKA